MPMTMISYQTSKRLWWIAAILLCTASAFCALTPEYTPIGPKLLLAAIVFFTLVIVLSSENLGDGQVRSWPYVLTLAVSWSLLVWGFRSAVIDGQRYFFLADDMMISMRYARNLVDGLGLVWNPGERLEGFTNPLWTLFMAAIHLLHLPDRLASLPLLIVSVIAGLISLPLAQRWARELGGNDTTQGLVLLAMMASAALTSSVILAFEQTIVTMLLMLAVVSLLDDIKAGILRPWGYICLGIIPLIRMDAAVLSVATGLWAIYEHPKRASVIACLFLAVIPSIIATIARHAYYGEWLPNTYYLKTSEWPDRWKSGIHYIINFLYRYGWLYLFVALIALRNRSMLTPAWRGSIAISTAQLAYAAYIGGDGLGIYRICAAVIPLIVAASLSANQILFKSRWANAVVAAFLLAIWSRPIQLIGLLSVVRQQDIGNIELSLKFNHEMPTARIADGFAGSLFYFAPQLRGIDVLGKMDAHIARMPVVHGGTVPGHNKFDFDYSIGQLRPEYVVAVFEGPEPSQEFLTRSYGNGVYPYYLWNNRAFREHCLHHPMPWNTWRVVFRCDWNDPPTT